MLWITGKGEIIGFIIDAIFPWKLKKKTFFEFEEKVKKDINNIFQKKKEEKKLSHTQASWINLLSSVGKSKSSNHYSVDYSIFHSTKQEGLSLLHSTGQLLPPINKNCI